MRKLNRKGFTLIELLAVIVILAVIMVIATTSVLSSMNESRKKSLLNSAESAASAFNAKYADLALTNEDEILGFTAYTTTEGGTTTDGLLDGNKAIYFNGLDDDDLDALNINETDYDLTTAGSFVYFNSTNSTFLVCFVAKKSGGFYVGAAASDTATTDKANNTSNLTGMWACSDGTHSWTNS